MGKVFKVFTEDPRTGETLKRCSKCGVYKKFNEYHKDRSSKHGIQIRCKNCTSKRKYSSHIDRFWKYYHSRYERVGDCLEWTGAKHADGQPVCQWDGRQARVRRVVYILAIGELTDKDLILMSCRNKTCVRQSHMVKGTNLDRDILMWNSAASGDRNGARTHPERMVPVDPKFIVRGEAHGGAKLTEATVRTIRDLYADGGIAQREIAEQFGIGQNAVSLIVRRKTWAHVQ